MGGQTWMPVKSPSRITPENNEKIRQKPDRENVFVMACGGGNATAEEPSLYRGLSSNGTENLHKVFMHHRHRRLMGHAMA